MAWEPSAARRAAAITLALAAAGFRPHASLKEWSLLAFLGLTSSAGYSLALNNGGKTLSASASSLVYKATPPDRLLAALFLEERMAAAV